MGNLSHDTEVTGSDGAYRAQLSPEWSFWELNGGYVSSVALRAAGAESPLPRPAAFYCHYLKAAKPGDVEINVHTLRLSKRTHSLRVSLTQSERLVMEALVWTVDDELPGVQHDLAVMPEVAPPEELRSQEEIHAGEEAPFPFWKNIEQRPITWQGRWDERPQQHPLWRSWQRFRPQATFDDLYVEAGRAMILIDTMLYPAAALAHPGVMPFVAPSMDLAVRFHQFAPHSEWLLSSTESPIATEGLIGGYAAVWSPDGRLLATGGQQMIVQMVSEQAAAT